MLVTSFLGGLSLAQSDDPCGAPALTVGASCSYATYTNATATASAGVPAPGCASYSGGDVWFTITVPASGDVTVDLSQGVITDGGMAIYSGTCGSLSLVECDDDDSPNGLMPMIALTGQTPGATLWVRVWEYGNNNNGTFDICAYEPTPVGTPANDDPCAATALTVGASCSFATYTNAGATASAGVPAPGCASYSGGDVWFTVTVPASGDVTVDLNTGVITDGGMAIYSGSCASLTLIECDDDDSPNGLMPMIALTGQTPGATLWVRVWEYGNNNNGTFDICAFEPVVAPPPANDDCSGAYPVTVNTTAGCASVTAGTVDGATASSQNTTSCGGTEDDDVWFSFVAPATGAVDIDLLNIAGSTTDMYHSVWEGTCPTLTLFGATCSDPNSQQVNGLTPGVTYFVRVYTWTATTGQTSTFDVCITEYTPPPAPSNDDCAGALPLTVNTSTCTSTTAGTVSGATASTQDPTACGGTENDDVWFSFVAPATGSVNVSLLNIAGSTTDMYHSVWEGTCPSLTLVAGSCSDPNSQSVTGLTPGNTYYLRVNTWSSTSGATSTFDVCLTEGTVCGGANNNDYCQAPAILTQGPGSWTSSTYNYYTADPPSNYGAGTFCGSVENNSWYQFTALSTTETFDFTSVTNCVSNSGIQAEVYEATTDVNGCCTSLTSVSNCWNPATATTGTVTATGLTIGNTYVLMVDGWGGDNCEFTVSNWTATGILPVELVHFNAIASTHHNIISWQTETEYNNDYFRVMRSYDGENFEEIAIVNGKGNSSIATNYQFNDMDVRNGDTYYQLEQVDVDGTTTVSDMISLNRKPMREGFLNMYPNPAKSTVTLELYNESFADATIEIVSMSGQMVYIEVITINGLIKKNINIANLSKGVYNVVVRQANEFEMTRLIVE